MVAGPDGVRALVAALLARLAAGGAAPSATRPRPGLADGAVGAAAGNPS